MIAVCPAMHEDDRDGLEPILAQGGEISPRRLYVERFEHLAIDRHAFRDLDHALGQLFGQEDMAREDIGPRLRSDP